MGFKQTQLASKMGVSQSAVNKIESGMLSADNYEEKFIEIKDIWKASRIEELEKEIEYIKSL